jgi:DNA uptake protein ComE-like DNA-binding protein
MLKLITALVVAMFAVGSFVSPLYAQAAKEPTKTETKQPAKPTAPKKAPLDLNTASEDELKALPESARPTQRRLSRTGHVRGRMSW